MKTNIILGSASPRRKELLAQIGVSFSIQSADIDETPFTGESPVTYVPRMASSKAYEVFNTLIASSSSLIKERTLVLASDTSVVLNEEIFGKPQSKSDFLRMMALLSGQKHKVITSVHV